jgi:hypothetical protein
VTCALVGLIALLSILYICFPILPKTLDANEYKDTILMIPQVKSVQGDINALGEWFAHYNNCFWFYADKNTVENTQDQLLAKINSTKKYFFVTTKENFYKIKKLSIKNLSVIKETKESVLFEN